MNRIERRPRLDQIPAGRSRTLADMIRDKAAAIGKRIDDGEIDAATGRAELERILADAGLAVAWGDLGADPPRFSRIERAHPDFIPGEQARLRYADGRAPGNAQAPKGGSMGGARKIAHPNRKARRAERARARQAARQWESPAGD